MNLSSTCYFYCSNNNSYTKHEKGSIYSPNRTIFSLLVPRPLRSIVYVTKSFFLMVDQNQPDFL